MRAPQAALIPVGCTGVCAESAKVVMPEHA